jgi:hypothetical protein
MGNSEVTQLQNSLTGDIYTVWSGEEREIGSLTFDERRLHGPEVWQLEATPSAPKWLGSMVADVNRLAHLPNGWDSYGAQRLGVEAAVRCMRILGDLGYRGAAPWVAPTNDGGLHMEWGKSDFGVEVEVHPNEPIVVVVDDAGNIEEWIVTHGLDSRLHNLIRAVEDVFH